jgi:phosphoribosylglycinamide formyltransferase 1
LKQKEKIAIFASGSGSNAEKIFQYFQDHPSIEVSLVLTNNPQAFVIERAKKYNIPTVHFNRAAFYETGEVLNALADHSITFIVLAGFLWLMPEKIVNAYTDKIINIHPALLPKFGGKGMYGMNVHKAVVEAGEKCSGITIHYVNCNYDEGNIIFQASCDLTPEDSPETVAQKVQLLEHAHYPEVIEKIIRNSTKNL